MNKTRIRILALLNVKKESIYIPAIEPNIWRLSSWETVENIINCWTDEHYHLKVIHL